MTDDRVRAMERQYHDDPSPETHGALLMVYRRAGLVPEANLTAAGVLGVPGVRRMSSPPLGARHWPTEQAATVRFALLQAGPVHWGPACHALLDWVVRTNRAAAKTSPLKRNRVLRLRSWADSIVELTQGRDLQPGERDREAAWLRTADTLLAVACGLPALGISTGYGWERVRVALRDHWAPTLLIPTTQTETP